MSYIQRSTNQIEVSVFDNLDSRIEAALRPGVNAFSKFIFTGVQLTPDTHVPIVIVLLVLAAVFLTFYFKFINLWGMKIAIAILRGKANLPEGGHGEVSHFQALTTALSGTVGVGNIGAVAIAVALGGPGAVFWLVIAGFFGMTTKFVECSLGVKYRRTNSDGSVSGGAMYYLERGLAEERMGRIGWLLARIYAVGIVVGSFGLGNMLQSNQAYRQVAGVFSNVGIIQYGWLFGIFFAALVGIVVIGGIQRIAQVTEKLVPLMATIYLSGALMVIFMNRHVLGDAVLLILEQAFRADGVKGGMIACLFWGFRRALISNEAGIGSSAIAHAAVKSDDPYSEGYVALLEPFIDTVIICSITSMVLVTSQLAYPDIFIGLDPGVAMTSAAFSAKFAWAGYPLALIVMAFAYSTAVSWCYYGLKGWTYLVGEGERRSMIYKMVFCVFLVIGSSLPISAIIDFSDAAVFLICIPNLVGLYFLSGRVRSEAFSAYERLVPIEEEESPVEAAVQTAS